MKTEDFINGLKRHARIENKLYLHDVLKILKDNDFNKERIYKDIGEDSAAIIMGDKYILITTDMISSEFLRKNAYSAGYSAILVGIDDIYACGGTPLTSAIDIQGNSIGSVHDLVKGAKKAAEQFGISITRGHTSLDEKNIAVSSTIIGEIKKEHYISAGNARAGDLLAMIWDPDGKKSPNGPYWDTVTFKSRDEVLNRRGVMCEVAREKLVHASKDISNAGLVGTTFMMCNYSRVGAKLYGNTIKKVFNCKDLEDLSWWITAFLTTGFLVSIDPENVDEARETSEENSLNLHIIGEVNDKSSISLEMEDTIHKLLDWNETPIFP